MRELGGGAGQPGGADPVHGARAAVVHPGVRRTVEAHAGHAAHPRQAGRALLYEAAHVHGVVRVSLQGVVRRVQLRRIHTLHAEPGRRRGHAVRGGRPPVDHGVRALPRLGGRRDGIARGFHPFRHRKETGSRGRHTATVPVRLCVSGYGQNKAQKKKKNIV